MYRYKHLTDQTSRFLNSVIRVIDTSHLCTSSIYCPSPASYGTAFPSLFHNACAALPITGGTRLCNLQKSRLLSTTLYSHLFQTVSLPSFYYQRRHHSRPSFRLKSRLQHFPNEGKVVLWVGGSLVGLVPVDGYVLDHKADEVPVCCLSTHEEGVGWDLWSLPLSIFLCAQSEGNEPH